MVRLAVLLASSAGLQGTCIPARIEGRRIFAGGRPLGLKGVNWNPVPIGGRQGVGVGVDFRGFVESDSELMAAAGINAVRTYEPLTDTEVLDTLWRRRIHVVNTVYVQGDRDPASVVGPVSKLRDHPAILMWAIGNEWNYNRLYTGMDPRAALARVQEVAGLIKSLDPTHPVATVYGMMPGTAQLAALDKDVDLWGITAYNGLTFGTLFDQWASATQKPMFLAEFGADAYNAQAKAVDEGDQAKATAVLMGQIVAHMVPNGGVCIGGFIFELADEWWKDAAGSPFIHDIGGTAPGIGPFPDHIFNEEYWGIVKNDGTPREAYKTYAGISVPEAGTGLDSMPMSAITAGYRLKACGSSPKCSSLLGDCCPGKDGLYQACCSETARQAGLQTAQAPASWVPLAQTAPARCAVNEAVPCCEGASCATCAGDQCCPSPQGLVTCPSAPSARASGCLHPKLYDCTGLTGTHAPAALPVPMGTPQANVPGSGVAQQGGRTPFFEPGAGAGREPDRRPGAAPPVLAFLAVLIGAAVLGGVAALHFLVWRKVNEGSDGPSRTNPWTGLAAAYEQAPSCGQACMDGAGEGGHAAPAP